MKILKLTFAVFSLFVWVDAWAGVKIVRTGGDVLVCANGEDPQKTETFEALDIQTSQDYRGLTPKVVNLTGDALERAGQLIERLRWLDPVRVNRYEEWLKAWPTKAVYEELAYDDIPDSAHFIERAGCSVLQAIIQEASGDEVIYRVSLPVWRKLGVNTRAFLIVHELIYRDASSRGHQNSFYVAYLNMLIAADAVETMTRVQYARLASEMKF